MGLLYFYFIICDEINVQLSLILTFALDNSGQLHTPAIYTPGSHSTPRLAASYS
jgi:hypothetical protein